MRLQVKVTKRKRSPRCILRAAPNADGASTKKAIHYANQAAFCQQLEMQMEAANAPDVAQAFRVCAFRSVPVPFPFRSRSVPFRSSFCVRAGVPCI